MGFCYQKNLSNPTLPVDEAQFYALVRAEKWNENIDKFRETGDASLNPQEQKARVTMLFDLRETDLSASKQVKVEADVASKFLEDNGAK